MNPDVLSWPYITKQEKEREKGSLCALRRINWKTVYVLYEWMCGVFTGLAIQYTLL